MFILQCSGCGLPFVSRMFGLGVGARARVRMENVNEACPRCNTPNKLPDGTFDLVGGTLLAVQGLTWTQAQRLRAVIPPPDAAPSAKADVVEAITEISPELGAIARLFGSRPGLMAVFLVFLFLFLSKCTVSVNLDVDMNRLWSQATQEASKHLEEAQSDEEESHAQPPGRSAGKEEGHAKASVDKPKGG